MRLAIVACLVSSLARADPPADAPRIEIVRDMTCLSAAALLNSERDRAALKREVEARQVGALVLGGVVGLVVGVVVGVLAAPLTKKP